MQTLKFKAEPTNAFFTTINHNYVRSSSQLTTTAEHCFVVWTQHSKIWLPCVWQ